MANTTLHVHMTSSLFIWKISIITFSIWGVAMFCLYKKFEIRALWKHYHLINDKSLVKWAITLIVITCWNLTALIYVPITLDKWEWINRQENTFSYYTLFDLMNLYAYVSKNCQYHISCTIRKEIKIKATVTTLSCFITIVMFSRNQEYY